MLNNTLQKYDSASTASANLSVLFMPSSNDPRLKRGNDLGSGVSEAITVSHTTTKENGAVGTARHLVRLDRVEPHPTDATAKPVTGFVQLIIGHPATMTSTAMKKMVRELVWYLVTGSAGGGDNPNDTVSGTIPAGTDSAIDVTVDAILDGTFP